ncbi:MAG: hypothetical protein K2N23_07185 [Clostridia bacterium]|nr:hypothetical protein [Clostridia bacterium]
MKVFKYKFTRLTISLIYVGIALCLVGIGINIYSVLTSDIGKSANLIYPIVQYTLTFLIPIVLLILLISLIFSSYYAIHEKTLKTSFGIIKSKYNIEDIKTILLDRTTNKLSVYLKNNTLFVIVVKEEWYEDFIDTLCKANPKIEYTINSKENDVNDKNDKLK